MKSIFGNGKHLQNVAAKGALDLIQVDILQVTAHDLLGCVVDEDVYLAVLVDVFLDRLLARLIVHEVAGDEHALAALLLNHLLGALGVFLLFWEVHDAHICTLTRKEDGD